MGKLLRWSHRRLFLLSLSSILLACGGGGGGGGSDSNSPPSALISVSVNHSQGLGVTLNGSASADTDGSILTYIWDLGDGSQANGNTVSHTYATAGTYTLQLTVIDNDGAAGMQIQDIVLAPGVYDPLFGLQWHLHNTGQEGQNNARASLGEDINVLPAWDYCGDQATCRGEGIVTAVIDDGLEISHEDLAINILAGQSYNYRNGSNNPSPNHTDNAHGTAVGGIIAARDENAKGGRGVAPRSQLVGYNLLEQYTDFNEADAMTRGIGVIDLANNSWGPPDNLGSVEDSSQLWRSAIQNGVNNGRNGLGINYIWAAGNGHPIDNSNYDGYANNPHVIAVGAVNARGTKASYSERGANLLVSAPGGESCDTLAIVTTDLPSADGFNTLGSQNELADLDYTQCMNGTSAATPNVAGVVALILQANPNLSWRDVRRILATTARRNDDSGSGWALNGAGYWVNHQYGFGVVDAEAAVTAARNWVNLPAQKTVSSVLKTVNQSIPDNTDTGPSDTITISGSDITNLEFVQVEFSASDHPYAGDLRIELTSPSGTLSILSETHGCFTIQDEIPEPADNCTALDDWLFGSVHTMGEAADGQWQLRVIDGGERNKGTFQSWKLIFYGY